MKVEVNGKTYCVETLIADNTRLRKDVIASAKTNRLVLDEIRAEIIDKYMTATGKVNTVAKGCLQIIDQYRERSE